MSSEEVKDLKARMLLLEEQLLSQASAVPGSNIIVSICIGFLLSIPLRSLYCSEIRRTLQTNSRLKDSYFPQRCNNRS